MLGAYLTLQCRLDRARRAVSADEGTTLLEYMLVLGLISVVIIVSFDRTGMSTAFGELSANLVTKITPAT